MTLTQATKQSDQRQTSREQRARLLDRWIDLLAAAYGMPRITLLRQLRTMPHLEMAVARLVAAHPQEADAGNTTAGHVPREQQSAAERARRDAETDEVLRRIKEASATP